MPETQYARSGDLSIAYQVFGDGPVDLVYVPGWVSNVELIWEEPYLSRFFRRLSSFARVITFDKRGTGLSDPVSAENLPDLETRMDDLRAVMDEVGSQSATLFGHSEGGAMCMLFAAVYPDRTDRLILTGSGAKRIRADDYPWAPTAEERSAAVRETKQNWGGTEDLRSAAPSRADDPAFQKWWGRYKRLSASPLAAATLSAMNSQVDVRSVLGSITAPTLLLYRQDDHGVSVEEGEYIAERIERARLKVLPGGDHLFWAGDTELMLEEIEEFVTGERGSADPDRRLATVMFTDIVGSTSKAASLGDSDWRGVLENHNHLVRSELDRWRGVEVGTAGDGFLATFDGPIRAINCCLAIRSGIETLGLQIRGGVHTGMVEVVGDDIAGLAVHIGSRIGGAANPGEVFVSSTVKDLVAGSQFHFDDRGLHALKGVPDEWHLFAVTD
jgi:pimeloyl-ACP methyl ester carboxylesterase